MVIEGGNPALEIGDGDDTPSSSDDTDFGTQLANTNTDHTFTIRNTGGATLNLTGSPIVAISGDSEFTVFTQPVSNSIASGGGDLTFVVRYAPTGVGMHTAVVSIDNNDCDENPYTFDVSGEVSACDITITNVTPTDETCPAEADGTVTVTASCTSCTGAIEYSIDGINFFTSATSSYTFTGLVDNNYTVTVQEQGNTSCMDMDNATVGAGTDTTPPTPGCQNFTVNLDATGNASITEANINNGSTDNCTDAGNLTLSLSQYDFDCNDLAINLPPAGWTNIGTAGFSAGASEYQSLAIYNGEPYVAFQDDANGDRTTVMKYDGSNWVNIGNAGFSAGFSRNQSLAFNNGEPYVGFRDSGNGQGATVMKFNGTSWVNVGSPGFSSGIAEGMDLVFDNGEPHVAFQDFGAGANQRATVMKFNGSSWVNVGNIAFSPGRARWLSLAFDSGEPYVSFQDGSQSDKITVMKYNGTSWGIVGSAGFSSGAVAYTSIAFENGEPYVAFRDDANGLKMTVMKFDGSNWVNVGSAAFSAGVTQYSSLAFYNGEPYVSYRDNGNLGRATVMKFDGSNWVNVGNAGFSTGTAGFPDLAFLNGNPMLAFQDGGNSSKTTVMQLSPGIPTTTLTVMDDEGNTATCVAEVTVVDNIAPTLTCPTFIDNSASLDFDDGNYVRGQNLLLPQGDAPRTIEAWFKSTNTSGWEVIFNYGTAINNQRASLMIRKWYREIVLCRRKQ